MADDDSKNNGKVAPAANVSELPPMPQFANPMPSIALKPSQNGGASTFQMQASLTMSAAALPFIPPEILAEYERVYPGLGARLIGWTERQQEHRMTLEVSRHNGSEKRQFRGQIGSIAVALIGLAIAGYVGSVGKEWAASVIAIVSVGGPLAAVVLASRFAGGAKPSRLPSIPNANVNAPSPADK